MRAPKVRVAIRNDAIGKPYLEIDNRYGDEASPVKFTMWADELVVEDTRKGMDSDQALDSIAEAIKDWGDSSQAISVIAAVLRRTGRIPT